MQKEYDHDKSYFLAQASHDLRQPLQALVLYLEMFETDNLTAAQKKIWQKIVKTTDNLKSLVNNVLDLSRLNSGNVDPILSYFNIGILLSNMADEFSLNAESLNICLEYSICNCKVESDQLLIERMLRHLLSNAFKFTSKNVWICCKEFSEYVEISVKDDGKGISKEDQTHMFEEFYRGKNSYTQNIDGAGLGLSIVRKISQILDIGMTVHSVEGKGSSFILKINKIYKSK